MLLFGAVSGCSIKRIALNQLGDTLAAGGTTFSSDEDPELVKAAAPFSLKLMESLLAGNPRHQGLLLAASSGFTQYAYAFVQQEADEMEEKDLAAAQVMRARAKRLYLRARNYGLRALAARHRGFEQALRARPKQAVRAARVADVPLLFWTAASWGLAISPDDPQLVAEQPIVEALIDRALELDEAYGAGAVHGFLITYEMRRQGGEGDAAERARRHFRRAVELSRGRQAAPFVALAEAVAVQKQDLQEFESLLARALAVDPGAEPEYRLANAIAQRRARWLLSRKEELFLIPEP